MAADCVRLLRAVATAVFCRTSDSVVYVSFCRVHVDTENIYINNICIERTNDSWTKVGLCLERIEVGYVIKACSRNLGCVFEDKG